MKIFRVGIRLAAGAWLLIGCVALVGLLRESDAQLVGWLLMVPAMILGLLRVPPGVLFSVFDGWPVLTWVGVSTVYFLVPVAFFLATRERYRRAAT